VSRCEKCGADYGRNRLASLAILLRGLRLCGQPFAVSADAVEPYQDLPAVFYAVISSLEIDGLI